MVVINFQSCKYCINIGKIKICQSCFKKSEFIPRKVKNKSYNIGGNNFGKS